MWIQNLTGTYRVLLSLFPRAFRQRFGSEMLQETRASVAEALHDHGRGTALRVWGHAIVDTLRTLAREWLGHFSTSEARRQANPDNQGVFRQKSLRPDGRRSPARFVESILQDLRFAVRSLLRTPVLTIVIIATLALGIGGNAAIFSILNGVLLRPLPYPDPERLAVVFPGTAVSQGELEDFSRGLSSGMDVAANSGRYYTLTGAGDPVEFVVNEVLPSHFDVLGARLRMGRPFAQDEIEPGAVPVVVLSHTLWKTRFGADPDILGRRIELSGRGADSRVVIGVMSEDFRPLRPDIQAWVPARMQRDSVEYRESRFIDVVARLHAGVGFEQAQDQFRACMSRLSRESFELYSAKEIQTARVMPLREYEVGSSRFAIWSLMGAVGLVLAISCVNVANLLLARGRGREAEMAIRSALGAGFTRILRQMLTEGLLLGAGAGIVGTAASFATESVWLSWLPFGMVMYSHVGMDLTVVLFSLGISILCGALFAVLPAVKAGGVGPQGLCRTRQNTPSASRSRWNGGLVAAEIALSLVVVASAGLLVQSAWNLRHVQTGFDPQGVATLRISYLESRFPQPQGFFQYLKQVRERVAALPGVESVGLIQRLPLGRGNTGGTFTIDGHVPSPQEGLPSANCRTVSPGYFESLRVPLLSGRDFLDGDGAGEETPALVNRAFAQRYWPGEDPVGRRITNDEGAPWLRVIGVVGNVRQHALRLPTRPEIYAPVDAGRARSMYLLARTSEDARRLLEELPQAIWSIDSHVPLSEERTMEEVWRDSLSSAHFFAALFGGFGGLALVLGAIGVYGVVNFGMSIRRREIGIRKALGGTSSSLLAWALKKHLACVAAGVTMGTLGALAAGSLLTSLLYEVKARDPFILMGAAALLILIAFAAAFIPARRAALLDPRSAILEQ